MEKIINVILIIAAIMFLLLFCWFLLMCWRSKNFKKRVRLGEVGMPCKYWIGEVAYYGHIQSYNPESDKVRIKEELIPQFLKNVEPSILNG